MLGNDIVDLQDADSRPESFRPRFDARVFSEEERRVISRDPNPLAMRWAHWAAKEAAFKLAKQADPEFIFSPSRLRVEFEPTPTGQSPRVQRRGVVTRLDLTPVAPGSIEVRSFESAERVHAVAAPVGSDWGAVNGAVESLESARTDASVAVRELAIREIARILGVAPSRLTVGRRDDGSARGQTGTVNPPNTPCTALYGPRAEPRRSRIPTVRLDGVPTSLSLSLSHHGRFVSFVMAPRVEPAIHLDRRRDHKAAAVSAGATFSS
jgi:hypothetical protein